jgi:hypothetical protein
MIRSDGRMIHSAVRTSYSDARTIHSEIRMIHSDARTIRFEFRTIHFDLRTIHSEFRMIHSGVCPSAQDSAAFAPKDIPYWEQPKSMAGSYEKYSQLRFTFSTEGFIVNGQELVGGGIDLPEGDYDIEVNCLISFGNIEARFSISLETYLAKSRIYEIKAKTSTAKLGEILQEHTIKNDSFEFSLSEISDATFSREYLGRSNTADIFQGVKS